MSRLLPLLLLLPAACGERHIARERAWLELALEPGEEVLVEVIVQTAPEAWPRNLYSDAIRTGFDDGPNRQLSESIEAVVIDSPEGREILTFPGALNVLDAWDDCDREQTCRRVIPLTLWCDQQRPCDGGLYAEAYLSTQDPFAREPPDGALQLQLQGPTASSLTGAR